MATNQISQDQNQSLMTPPVVHFTSKISAVTSRLVALLYSLLPKGQTIPRTLDDLLKPDNPISSLELKLR